MRGSFPASSPDEDEGNTWEHLRQDPPDAKWLIAKDVLSFLGGGVLVLVAAGFVYHIGGNPLHDLALIRGARLATGSLVDSFDVEVEDDRGHVDVSQDGVYAFRSPDGREYMTKTNAPVGQLERSVVVEYLPSNPAINRVKGDGARNITDLVLRKIGLGLLLLVAFSSVGVSVMWRAIQRLVGHVTLLRVQNRDA